MPPGRTTRAAIFALPADVPSVGMPRLVILFARSPRREARAKGFSGPEGAELFAAFAAGWGAAARRAGARLAISTPPEDLADWRRLSGIGEAGAAPFFFVQRGRRFGDRLEDAARRAGEGSGNAVLGGGDVAPSDALLREAFEALENGADAVGAPASDGGVSLLALSDRDLELLSALVARRRDVCARLLAALATRGRRVHLLRHARDVDGRSDVRRLARPERFECLDPSLTVLARRALEGARISRVPVELPLPHPTCRFGPGLRAPPRAA